VLEQAAAEEGESGREAAGRGQEQGHVRLPAPGSTQAKFYSSKWGELGLYILIQNWPDSVVLFSREQGQILGAFSVNIMLYQRPYSYSKEC
jgi:hypothetical protein